MAQTQDCTFWNSVNAPLAVATVNVLQSFGNITTAVSDCCFVPEVSLY